MVFSSVTFLFLFLPIVLAAFWLTPPRWRTPLLVAASWIFYAWGEKALVALLVVSALFNWAIAIEIADATGRARRVLLSVAIAVNLAALVYFKYTDFFLAQLNAGLAWAHLRPVIWQPVHLPIGISFVTFEAISYLVDVHRGHLRPAKSPVGVAFYLAFFPHLIAGPILRYADIAPSLEKPRPGLTEFDRGVARFITGLGKKVLIANVLGQVSDQIFALPGAQLGTAVAWLGIVCYSLQIYFDFSGYSDMAIGLGHLFGFTLPENFRLPYTADSIRDFWRRWHISLSSWFRDYLFLPLGGSRGGAARTARNLLIVFLLCGLWHGASTTFIVWGLYHGVFLALERTRFGDGLARLPVLARRGYAVLVVMVGWVFFRTATLAAAGGYLAAMFGNGGHDRVPLRFYLSPEVLLVLAVAVPLSVWSVTLRPVPALVVQTAVLVLSLLYVAAGTYNPFIYFRF
jgi:alginate O-acetyltransferase complex protein AlgI